MRRNRKEENISRLRFGHSGLNNTLFKINCEFCGQKEIEHVITQCWKYEEERRLLIQNLSKIKIQLSLEDMLQNGSGDKCYQILFQYLRETNLIERIKQFFVIIIPFEDTELSRHCDLHSISVGGGNALIRCLPTANKKGRRTGSRSF